MSLEFLHTRFTFHMSSRSVQMTAVSNGVPLKVIISRATLEHVASAQNLNQDESLTVAAQNLELLRLAADHAADKWRAHSTIVTVEPWDVITCAAQHAAKPLKARLAQGPEPITQPGLIPAPPGSMR